MAINFESKRMSGNYPENQLRKLIDYEKDENCNFGLFITECLCA